MKEAINRDCSEIILTEDEIQKRVAEIGALLTTDYADKAADGIILVSVLRGSCIFAADLVRKINLPVEIDFMAVSSYGNGVKTSGVVKIIKDVSSQIEGKHVIIAEDILDSGLTLDYLISHLKAMNPASIDVVTLLWKKECQKVDITPRYYGFDCPNAFIVGYGLDYAERYRNLPYIGILKPEVYE